MNYNSRRSFFGQLGLIIGAAACPTILIPKSNINWGKPIKYVQQTYQCKATWCPEFLQDLQSFHEIDAETELDALIFEEIRLEFAGKEVLKVEKSKELAKTSWYSFTPHYHIYATIKERV